MRSSEFITDEISDNVSFELQKLIDKARETGTKMASSRELKYQLHIPRIINSAFTTEDIKPNAKLWTSTAIYQDTNTYTSAWAEWCNYNAPGWISDKGFLYQVQSNASVLHIGSDQTARAIAAKVFGKEFKPGGYAILGNYPWDELGKYIDAVRYPARSSGNYNSRLNNILMSLWDVESTAWYNTNNLKLLGEVNIKRS